MQTAEQNCLKKNAEISELADQPLTNKTAEQKFFKKAGLDKADDHNRQHRRHTQSGIDAGRGLGKLRKKRQMRHAQTSQYTTIILPADLFFCGRIRPKYAANPACFRPFMRHHPTGIKPKITLAKTVLRNASRISIIFS